MMILIKSFYRLKRSLKPLIFSVHYKKNTEQLIKCLYDLFLIKNILSYYRIYILSLSFLTDHKRRKLCKIINDQSLDRWGLFFKLKQPLLFQFLTVKVKHFLFIFKRKINFSAFANLTIYRVLLINKMLFLSLKIEANICPKFHKKNFIKL